jgi:hypothetical protein
MEPIFLDRCLEHLRALPFVDEATVRPAAALAPATHADVELHLRTPAGDRTFAVEVKETHLTNAHAEYEAFQVAEPQDRPRILFARFVPPALGRRLVDRGLCFVDEAGNCHVAIGREYVARIEGRRQPPRAGRGRGMGVAGYQTLFAILANPKLLDEPIRTIAEQAGVGKTAVAHALERLTEEGLLGKGLERRHLLRVPTVLDRWLVGYENLVRPRLLVGRFHTPETDPMALEKHLQQVFGRTGKWGLGGGAAAMRLTGHYRGAETVVHVADPPADFRRQLRALPARDGRLTILRARGKLALQGALPDTVHPLLVFTELINAGEERARETAGLIREKFLKELG